MFKKLRETSKINWILGFAILFSSASQADLLPTAQKKSHQARNIQNSSFTVSQQIHIQKLSNYIQKHYRVPSRKASLIVSEAFRTAAYYQMSPELILSIIAVESTFRERAVSHKGARGLMQVIPRWHPQKVRAIGGAHALFDPEKNIRTGSQILVQYLQKNQGDLRRALLQYNGSLKNPKSRYADKVLRIYHRMKKLTRVS